MASYNLKKLAEETATILLSGQKQCVDYYREGLSEKLGDWEKRRGEETWQEEITACEIELVDVLAEAFEKRGLGHREAVANANTYIRAARRTVLHKADWQMSRCGARDDVKPTLDLQEKLLADNPDMTPNKAYRTAVQQVIRGKRVAAATDNKKGFVFRAIKEGEEPQDYLVGVEAALAQYLGTSLEISIVVKQVVRQVVRRA